MQRFINIQILLIAAANLLTTFSAGAANTVPKLEIPPCPAGTERAFMPDATKPTWTGCKDTNGLYQGMIIQLSGQLEILRAAGVKDSLRDGREIRFGAPGTLEERTFKGGHLNGKSWVFKSETTLGRVFPKPATAADWFTFTQPTENSALKVWLKTEPVSTIEYQDGRMTRLQFGDKDYKFKVSKDGRIYPLNHPDKDLKKGFFIDPEAFWDLNAADLKAALLPGFGSCKKYSGPIGRFGRHYDHLLYRRESNEKKQLDALAEIRARFIKFCVPEDITQNAGILECPPQLPSAIPAQHCLLPLSDQIHIPYEPKYFVYEFTLGRAPDEIHEIFRTHGLAKFMSTFGALEDNIKFTPKIYVQIKRTPNGVMFRPLEIDEKGRIKIKKEDNTSGDANKDWYEWHRIPGY